jgi:hypothetical protein
MEEIIAIEKIDQLSQYVTVQALVLEKVHENEYLVGDTTGMILVNVLGAWEGDLTLKETYQFHNAKISLSGEKLHLFMGNWGKILPSTTLLSIDVIKRKYMRSTGQITASQSHRSAWNLFLSIITFSFLGKAFRR